MKYSLKVYGKALEHLTAEAWGGASRNFVQGSVIDWLCWEIGSSMGDTSKWEYESMSELLYFKHEEDKVKFILRWL